MSSYRIRFRFNQQAGGKATFGRGGTRGFENFARAIVQDVAFETGNEMFELIRTSVQQRMQTDIQRELNHMAQMFMGGVVGIPGRNRGPRGTLTTVAPESEAMKGIPQLNGTFVKGLTGDWPRREPSYMQSRKWAGDAWFQRTGSVLAPLASGKTWTSAFGGISISVARHTTLERKDAGSTKLVQTGYGSGKDARISICTIRVQAMNRITPSMLPALGGGSLGDFGGNPRASGLLNMLGERAAWRLGGNPHTVPFRPTIQPFLGYFLTRSMPNAVFKRIEQGFSNQRWKWTDVHGAGRNR
jgi:hypothetical protein